MKRLWLLLAIAVPLQFIHAQEVKQVPTVAECRADQKLWLNKLEQNPARSGVANVSFGELNGWQGEMIECEIVDRKNKRRYYATSSEVVKEQSLRLLYLAQHHNLYDQFLVEVVQGKR
jgi:hypothetical protein